MWSSPLLTKSEIKGSVFFQNDSRSDDECMCNVSDHINGRWGELRLKLLHYGAHMLLAWFCEYARFDCFCDTWWIYSMNVSVIMQAVCWLEFDYDRWPSVSMVTCVWARQGNKMEMIDFHKPAVLWWPLFGPGCLFYFRRVFRSKFLILSILDKGCL